MSDDVQHLLSKAASYLSPAEVDELSAAYAFGATAHAGQTRQSGEPYISHPVAVAHILTDWKLDVQALIAAMLHDVVEDTVVSKAELVDRFGKTVGELVDGLSKLDKIEFQSKEEAQAENFRKMLLAMARDIRIILIKLADRLHNMRTMESMRPDKQKRIARETMDIYAPIANRIGLNSVYQELDELGFRFLHPNRYQVLQKAVKAARGNRRHVVDKILSAIQDRLNKTDITAEVHGREKHLYSIYKKMQEKHLSFSEVLDIYGFRVVVEDRASCYLTLGELHGLYHPVPGKFKDYIAIPKANGYQSLHTTLIGPFGTPIEIQLRTREMHQMAEAGIASHWMYKSADGTLNDIQQHTHKWLQRLLEIQSESRDASEFLEHIKVDLFPDEVYVFTPKGRILPLPQGATAVDFAYAVHTDIGAHCVAARINLELMPLRTHLRSGDRVDIITDDNAFPNRSWLSFVATGKARSHIRHYLKTMQLDESVELGARLLKQALLVLAPGHAEMADEAWERYLREAGVGNQNDVLADIGLGKRLSMVVARGLLLSEGIEPGDPGKLAAIPIRGWENMALRFAACCYPIPGDPITGYLHKGQGMVVHMSDCSTIHKPDVDQDKLVNIEWDAANVQQQFEVAVDVLAHNQRGVLAMVAAAISEQEINITNVQVDDNDAGPAFTPIRFTLQVRHLAQLNEVLRALRTLPVVERIQRHRSPQS